MTAFFLDNVVTSTLVFEGKGAVNEYVGGYNDWLRQRQNPVSSSGLSKSVNKEEQPAKQTETSVKNKVRKLSYKEQRELDGLPARLDALETGANRFTGASGFI